MPFFHNFEQFRPQPGVDSGFGLKFKIVSDLEQIDIAVVIHIGIRFAGPFDLDAVFIGTLEIGAEPFQPQVSHALGRREMEKEFDQLYLLAIVLSVSPGNPIFAAKWRFR